MLWQADKSCKSLQGLKIHLAFYQLLNSHFSNPVSTSWSNHLIVIDALPTSICGFNNNARPIKTSVLFALHLNLEILCKLIFRASSSTGLQEGRLQEIAEKLASFWTLFFQWNMVAFEIHLLHHDYRVRKWVYVTWFALCCLGVQGTSFTDTVTTARCIANCYTMVS